MCSRAELGRVDSGTVDDVVSEDGSDGRRVGGAEHSLGGHEGSVVGREDGDAFCGGDGGSEVRGGEGGAERREVRGVHEGFGHCWREVNDGIHFVDEEVLVHHASEDANLGVLVVDLGFAGRGILGERQDLRDAWAEVDVVGVIEDGADDGVVGRSEEGGVGDRAGDDVIRKGGGEGVGV